jgi:hypothetical protein
MPNGHSGGFQMEVAALAALLESVGPQDVVGKLVHDPPPLTPVTATEVLRALSGVTATTVPVEEQDRSFYVVHFTDKPRVMWLMVTSASPIFSGLRERHSSQKLA